MKYVKASLMVVILLVLVCGASSVEAGEIVGQTTCHELFTGKEDLWPTWHSLPIAVELYPSDKSGKIQRDLTCIKIIYSKDQWGTENYKRTDINSLERLKLINLLKEGLECCKTAKASKIKIEKTFGSVVDTDNDSLTVAFKSKKKAKEINVILKIKDSDYYLDESEASKLVQYLMEPEEEKKKAEEERKRQQEAKKKAAEKEAIAGVVTIMPTVTGGVYDSPAMKMTIVEAFPAGYNGGAYINSAEVEISMVSMLEPSLASAQLDKVQTWFDKYRKNAKSTTNSQRLQLIQLLKKGLKWTETAKSNKVDIQKPIGNLTGDTEIKKITFHSENKAEKVYVSMQLRDITTGQFRTVKFHSSVLGEKEAQQKIDDQLAVTADQAISRGLFEDVEVEIELGGEESELRDFILVLEKVPEHAKLLKEEEEAKKKKVKELFK